MEPMAKKRRLEQNSNENNRLMSMNDHCLLNILEYLDIDELSALGQTCKKFKEFVDTFVSWKFSHQLKVEEVAIQLRSDQQIILEPVDEYISHFLKFIQNVRIGEDFEKRPSNIVNFMRKNCNGSLESIAFQRIKFHHLHGVLLADWLSGVEGLAFLGCTQLNEILKHCSNLKNLVIDKCADDSTANRWVDEKYPTVQHMQLGESKNLGKFLTMTPNVKEITLKLPDACLELIQQSMRQLRSIPLRKLLINFSSLEDIEWVIGPLNDICNNTEFIRLELCFDRFFGFDPVRQHNFFLPTTSDWDFIPHLRDLTKLVALHILELHGTFPSGLISEHVKVLHLTCVSNRMPDLYLSENFPNLEEFYVSDVWDDLTTFITPLVRRAAKLKKIVAKCVKIKNRMEMTWAGLAKHFNDEREKLANACALVIYIDEDACDESTEPLVTDLRLVRLKKVHFQLREVNFVDPFLVNFSF